VGDGDPITVWCNNRACGYWLETRRQYCIVLSVTDRRARSVAGLPNIAWPSAGGQLKFMPLTLASS
jgi:hypothetical protein